VAVVHVFEGQCAARIRERSMIDHALTQMDWDDKEEDDDDARDDSSTDPQGVDGSCYGVTM
jgi:hypothetical protein